MRSGSVLSAAIASVGIAVAIAFTWTAAPAAASDGADAEIAALKREIADLKKSTYHPELGDQMLGLQLRHARLWFAGRARNWTLAAYELQEIKETFEAIVEHNPEHAALQPQRLADVLPAMTKAPVLAVRDAIDHASESEFERAYDGLSAACNGCHRVAGNDFLVIQRPSAPLLDNLRTAPDAVKVLK